MLGGGLRHGLSGRDIPDFIPGKSELYPNAAEWINQGDSVVIEPGGKAAAGPMLRPRPSIIETHSAPAPPGKTGGRWRVKPC